MATPVAITVRPTSTVQTPAQDAVVAHDMRGGAPRVRNDIVGATELIEVTWSRLSFVEYATLCAHYNAAPVGPWDLEMFVAPTGYATYRCTVIPGSFKLTGQRGGSYDMVATLEVTEEL